MHSSESFVRKMRGVPTCNVQRYVCSLAMFHFTSTVCFKNLNFNLSSHSKVHPITSSTHPITSSKRVHHCASLRACDDSASRTWSQAPASDFGSLALDSARDRQSEGGASRAPSGCFVFEPEYFVKERVRPVRGVAQRVLQEAASLREHWLQCPASCWQTFQDPCCA